MKRLLVIFFLVVILPIGIYHWSKADSGSQDPVEVPANPVERQDEPVQETKRAPRDQIGELIDNEFRIRDIEPILKKLKRSCENLELINSETRELFTPKPMGVDISRCELVSSQAPGPSDSQYKVEFKVIDWKQDSQSLWVNLINRVSYFQFVRFYPVKVKPRGLDSERFVIDAGFEALARTDKGWLTMLASGELEFIKNEGAWKINRWGFDNFKLVDTEKRMFRDSTAEGFSAKRHGRGQPVRPF